jgi:hypothetical protein
MTSSRRRRRAAGLAAILGLGAFVLVAVGPVQATTPLGAQTQISVTGADGDATLDATDASVAYNPSANQYLVVWQGGAQLEGEIVARLVDAAGAPLGAQFTISDMGPPAAAGFGAEDPAVAYNVRRNEYLVVWRGEDDTGPLVDGEFEIFAQRLTAGGDEVGADDRRISDMGPDGDTAYSAQSPAIAYNPTSDEYLVAWEGDDDAGPLVDGEDEVFVQRLDARGAQVGTNDRRISDMGPNGDTAFSADNPAVAHNSTDNGYLVAWEGDDGTGALVDNEVEIFAQRLAANGAEEGANDRRISDMGPDGDDDFEANDPSLAYNPASGEYLVIWDGDDDTGALVASEDEIYAQRLVASGAPVGTNDRRISQMGPDGDTRFDARSARVVLGTRANEYLVAWQGSDDTGARVTDEFEVHAQRLGPDGAEIGGDDVRVSVMGVDGDDRSDGLEPAVAYGSQANEYLIAWHADTGLAPRVNDEFEVYERRFGAGVPAASAVCRVLPPVPPPTPGDPSDIRLTTGQLLINQRIDQAAIRRANGVSAWLGDGIEARDLCQGSLAASELAPGIVSDLGGPPLAFTAPDPRPIVVAPAKPGDPSDITLTVGQLLINQRISQAAIRRLNALKARMDGGLTGGDVDDGTLTQPVFIAGLRVLVAPPPASPPPRSTTDIAPARPGDPSQVTLTTGQLLINQRISQAAVRRANDLIARIEDGLVASDVRDGTVTALELAPGVVVP